MQPDRFNERVVLGSLIRFDGLLADVSHLLAESSFTEAKHQQVFAAIQDAEKAGKVDLVAVVDAMGRAGHPDPVFVAELATDAFCGRDVAVRHAQKLKELSDRRRVANAALELMKSAQDEYSDCTEAEHEMREALDAQGASETDGSVPMQQALGEFYDWCESAQESSGNYVPTPWHGLNDLVTGFFPAEVTVLAGRPSNGKTAAGLNIAYHAASKGHPVGVVSMEMSRNMLLARMAAGHLRIDARKFRSGKLTEVEMESVQRWCGDHWNLPLHMYDKTDLRPSVMRSMIRRWKREHGVSLVVVDYLQLMDSDAHSGNKNRENEVSEISRAIKKAAVEFDVHFVLLSQLNREVEKRKDKEPILADLRESGSIEQDADNVLMIRPWDHTTSQNTVRVSFKLAKARNDQTGNVQLVFMRSAQKFADEARI